MSEEQAAANHEPSTSSSGTLNLFARGARDGAADAREAAARTWAATSLFASRFVYTTCYTLSYGVVFPSMLLARAVPRDNVLVQGLIDGAQAAKEKVDQMAIGAIDEPIDRAVPALAPA